MPKEHLQTYILYKVDHFDDEYSELFGQFPEAVVIREKNFHDDFISVFERLDTRYVLFGTDDVVYYDSVDFAVIDKTFEAFPGDIFGFSLRLEPQTLIDEADPVVEVETSREKIYRINWQRANSRNGRYPFELNSTVYRTSLVKRILRPVAKEHPKLEKVFARDSLLVKSLSVCFQMKNFLASLDTFHDPNALEGHCYRWCKTHKWELPGYIYFQRICASAIQVNRVNVTVDNPVDGSAEHGVEALNKKYKQGYRFDMETIEEHKPERTHVGQEYFKLVKGCNLRDDSCEALKKT